MNAYIITGGDVLLKNIKIEPEEGDIIIAADSGYETALRLKLEKQSGRNVLLECSTDSTLLGGIVVEMDGKILDGSIRRRLQEVKEVMNL